MGGSGVGYSRQREEQAQAHKGGEELVLFEAQREGRCGWRRINMEDVGCDDVIKRSR